MKLLAVETATSWQSVAILDGDRLLAQHEQDAAGGAHAGLLLPTIDRLLKQTGLRVADLNGLACSIGPGSFTGIRVGVSTCLGLRTATDLPLALVPTLEAMAWTLKDAGMPICPVVTSRKGEVYWAVFRWTDGRLERLLSEHVGSPRAVGQSLTGQTVCIGDGWVTHESDIRAALAPTIRVIESPSCAAKPSALSVGLIGIEKLRRGEAAGPSVAPLYVQRAEAEIKYEQSGGLSPIIRRQERVARKVAERQEKRRLKRAGPGKARD